MGNVTVYLHKKTQDFADLVASVLDTSRSEVVDDMLKYIRDNNLEEEVWEGYADALEAFEEEAEESEEEESESEEEEEEEEE